MGCLPERCSIENLQTTKESQLSLKILAFFKGYFFKRFYLFLEQREGRKKERERNTDQLPLIHATGQGPNMQARHVP